MSSAVTDLVREITTGKTPTPWERKMPDPYPDYSKAMSTQLRGSPTMSGLTRGAETGLLSAILTGLAARAVTDDPQKVLLASLFGGGIGALPGYISGKRERESQNSRLLSLRRMGIDTPAELEFASRYPGMLETITSEGKRI